MLYTPAQFADLESRPGKDLQTAAQAGGAAILRSLQVVGVEMRRYRADGRPFLFIGIDEPPGQLAIPSDEMMVFGSETLTAREYFTRVIEPGDRIDVVVSADQHASQAVLIAAYWIEIRYAQATPPQGRSSYKEDGLFALRTKSGEKAERLATRLLVDHCGHAFAIPHATQSPGFFEIRYERKARRDVDRTCQRCGIEFEIKKRNKDRRFRVSHSESRPFGRENKPSGWHAFVFPDMTVHFVPNEQILEAMEAGRFQAGSDSYDSWAEIYPAAIKPCPPPVCASITQAPAHH